MTKDEVIIVKNILNDDYTSIAIDALKYALISVAFTYNRMEKNDLNTRIANITKGKIAEGLFHKYCADNGIYLDFQSCTTPFWMPDLRDFLWLGGEWDIKNNYFYCDEHEFQHFDTTLLPALIPNKNINDQWSKRNENHHADTRFTAFVFTFMRLHPLNKHFFNIKITEDQYQLISAISSKYNRIHSMEMPFSEQWFFDQLHAMSDEKMLTMNYFPELIITACANARYWTLFQNTSIDHRHYQDHLTDQSWYRKKNNVLSFMDDKMITKIKNKTCPIHLLPSFHQLVHKIKC